MMPFLSRSNSRGPASVSSSGPPSPTMSAHTTATNVGLSSARLPAQLINRADLRSSLSAYEALLTASKAYTQALIALGSASSDLATALDTCSRLKGAHQVGSGLLAASGVHHMASNSWSILADTFWKDTSIPLMEHHDLYVHACAERTLQHEKAIVSKSRALNEAEKRNQKESRSKSGRDLLSFRRALMELQRHVNELDEEKARYYADVLEGEEECWSFVQDKLIASLRSQLDMFERISNKGMSDAVLEPLLSTIPDPFSAYGPPRNDDQIFSILNHGSLLGLSHSPDVSYDADDPSATSTTHGVGEKSDRSGGAASSGGSEHKNIAGAGSTLKPASLIMSPSTPSKGLSRVTSGAASPKPTSDGITTSTAGTAGTTTSTTTVASAAGTNGLGISLTAAVQLARQQATNGERTEKTAQPQQHAQQHNLISESNAELFGTDGEDDGGDEASIFSGTEDDIDGTGAVSAGYTDEVGVGSQGKLQLGMAARIMQEKKRRRENAVRASAKTRLKHALSTIDESKGPHANALAIAADASSAKSDEDGEKTITTSLPRSRLGERNLNTNTPIEKGDSNVSPSDREEALTNARHEHDIDSVWT